MKQLKKVFLLSFVLLTVLILFASSYKINAWLKFSIYVFQAFALFFGLRLMPNKGYVTVMFTGLVTAVAAETVNAVANGKNDCVDDVLINFVGTVSGIAAGVLIVFVIQKIYLNIIAPKKR